MTEKALRDVFGDFLVENAEKYENMIVLDADLSSSTRTYKFAEKFPERFFNMGIAEQNMMGTAIGFAISGKIPVVSGFSVFTTGRAWEFIRLACHDNLNVKIIATHGGFVGKDGSTHHALEDINIMATLPNLNILVPCDELELIQMLDYAFNSDGPFFIRLPRGSFPKIHEKDYNFHLGKPDLIKEGKDLCLIGSGYGVHLALNSVRKIEEEFNLPIKVLNLHTIKPIDSKELSKQLETVKAVITIEENNSYNGIGSIISKILSNKNPRLIRSIGLENFGQSGNRKDLLDFYGLDCENVMRIVKDLIKSF